ncbi:MAG: tRNA (adenine-N1)-methyltransferase [Candidatus Helarchaeota archaeon]|nr:tRNA (adenine-N1)-methyltransferase [Candidatus Helarchaeota archaeon]
MEKLIQSGDYILIVFDEPHRWLVQVRAGDAFHTNKGFIKFDDIIGKPYGVRVHGSKGHPFSIFTPTTADFLFKAVRQTQIIYPKDASFILITAGIGPGWRVVEAGSGSGGLTSVLAFYVQPTGKVYGYEINEEFLKKARKNITRLGLDNVVEFKNRDIFAGIEEKEVDAVVLDLATPWEAVHVAYGALKNAGSFVSFSPTVVQVQKTIAALRDNRFGDIRMCELLLRPWQVSRKMDEVIIRPQTQMIGHTGFLTFARKMSMESEELGHETEETETESEEIGEDSEEKEL